MKKKTLSAAAMMVATMGVGATPQTLPVPNKVVQQKTNDAVAKIPTTVRQGKPTALNPTGGYDIFYHPGLSPKEYGQRLQMLGRQKWSIKRRK